MVLRLECNESEDKRFSFTNKKDAFWTFTFSKNSKFGTGYFKDGKCFLKDILPLSNNIYAASLTPDKVSFCYSLENSNYLLDISLLLYKNAFYIDSQSAFSINGLLCEGGNYYNYRLINSDKQCYYLFTLGSNISIISYSAFGYQVKNNAPFGQNIEINPSYKGQGFYLTFNSDAKELLLNDERSNHRDKINTFLDNFNLDTGDAPFNDAAKWASFSAWLLTTDIENADGVNKGIWAGLPWFCDNWGRDTFISLCGTLLVTGCYQEARSVLIGFSKFQNKDPSSKEYGRIPNRYRNEHDVIYNTIDGNLYFIRALWEYINYTGDKSILEDLKEVIKLALNSDIARCDERGFLLHGDADSWMDARIRGKEAWSPRGNRAVDVEALWFTALIIGSKIMNILEDYESASKYKSMAIRVKNSFNTYFISLDNKIVSDHLKEGTYGEYAKDLRVRPNQLVAITADSVIKNKKDKSETLLDNAKYNEDIGKMILNNVERELVTPYGVLTLSAEDPLFHAHHEDNMLYNKDAAYHNGTIWPWNLGLYVSAKVKDSKGFFPYTCTTLLQNTIKMIAECGSLGAISENIHAEPSCDNLPILSGTYSQAWSEAEFARILYQDLLGFNPNLQDKTILFLPSLPASLPVLKGKVLLPDNSNISIKINRVSQCDGVYYNCFLNWWTEESKRRGKNIGSTLTILYYKDRRKEGEGFNSVTLNYNNECNIRMQVESGEYNTSKFCLPETFITKGFNKKEFNNEWVYSSKWRNYLEHLILSGKLDRKNIGGENTAALEMYYDSKEFNERYYTQEELGFTYSKEKTTFKLWSPVSKNAEVLLYKMQDKNLTLISKIQMKRQDRGVWQGEYIGEAEGLLYEFATYSFGVYKHFPDPYARACGVNGDLSSVVDFNKTNPSGWEEVKAPEIDSPCDAIIYEVHIRDISMNASWSGKPENKGRFLALTETNLKYKDYPIGLDYIKRLGVTHLQLLPIFDYGSVDERDKNPSYNWGYDPKNYGCIEGSYSSCPSSPSCRIKELKEVVKTYAEAGIGIVMDVVFNHVYEGQRHSLGLSVPGYYYRVDNYSTAGEDTASERAMVRQYIVSTLSFLLKEYKLSGFRFDLMGLHDVLTMNEIADALRKIKKDVLLYGEGWDMYKGGKFIAASQKNAALMPFIAHFNDCVRDGIKGVVFDDRSKGYIHNGSFIENIKAGAVGMVKHNQVEREKISCTCNKNAWSTHSSVSMNYVEIHDNLTLNDKLRLTQEGLTEEGYTRLVKMALSLVLLFQGVPVLHAGGEFMRSKRIPTSLLKDLSKFSDVASTMDGRAYYLRNSYNAPDLINLLDWARASDKRSLVEYVRALIRIRKTHPAFRIEDGKEIQKDILFIPLTFYKEKKEEEGKKKSLPSDCDKKEDKEAITEREEEERKEREEESKIIAWCIKADNVKDRWKKVLIVASPLDTPHKIALPLCPALDNTTWHCATDGDKFYKEAMEDGDIEELQEGSNIVERIEGRAVPTIKSKSVSVFYTL